MKGLPLVLIVTLMVAACTYERYDPAALCAKSGLTVKADSITDVSACGAKDGALVVSGSGGAKGYQFRLDSGAWQTSGKFSGLGAGDHKAEVKDLRGCVAEILLPVSVNAAALKLVVTTSPNTSCPEANGVINVSAAGGAEPYQFRLNGKPNQLSTQFSLLKAGTYIVSVTDATGCIASLSAAVDRVGPSYSSDIRDIIITSCAKSGCHSGSRSPSLTTYAEISQNASAVAAAIVRNMPPGGQLPQSQIDLITCWANDGAPNN